ncbi:hypothetical protein ANO11243_059980 [Dothideomycetidae sp. 11243]|nr:hypothetical protein ANO11243_059980 [fungal sp. No.11243]
MPASKQGGGHVGQRVRGKHACAAARLHETGQRDARGTQGHREGVLAPGKALAADDTVLTQAQRLGAASRTLSMVRVIESRHNDAQTLRHTHLSPAPTHAQLLLLINRLARLAGQVMQRRHTRERERRRRRRRSRGTARGRARRADSLEESEARGVYRHRGARYDPQPETGYGEREWESHHACAELDGEYDVGEVGEWEASLMLEGREEVYVERK